MRVSLLLVIDREAAQWRWDFEAKISQFGRACIVRGLAIDAIASNVFATRESVDHSHSILSTHRNALIYKSNFFLMTVETRPSSRQNFSLLISKEKSRDSKFARFRQLSPTIGQFFASSIAERILRENEKRPSAFIAQGVRTGDVCIHLIT